jgi:hypothetical protein
MPINPGEKETEDEFISRCMGVETGDYEQDQAYAICKSKWDNQMKKEVSEEAQQGGVVAGSFGRTKFGYPVKNKESLNDYMARCMSDDLVREKKPNRGNRAGFCYTEYQNRYILSIGKGWK